MIEIPISVLIACGSGLVTAVVFIFRMLLVSNERRIKASEELNASTLAHHEVFVAKAQQDRTDAAATVARLDAQSAADRERYSIQLEKLVTSIAAERNTLQRQMLDEVERLIKEVPSIMVMKLVELGVIKAPVPPSERKKADRKPPAR